MAFATQTYAAPAQTSGSPKASAQADQPVTGSWKKSSGSWWYSYSDGTYAKSGWKLIDGAWYYFDGAGWMQTRWLKAGGAWYYLNGSGAMATGWKKVSGTWYYLKSSGAMATGWQKVGGTWYFLNSSGAMQANKWVGDYYLQGDGSMAVNKWIGQYYVGSDGKWIRYLTGLKHAHSWVNHTATKQVWIPKMVTVPTYKYETVYGARFYIPDPDNKNSYIAKGPTYWFENGFTRDDLEDLIYNALKNADKDDDGNDETYNGVYYGNYQNVQKTNKIQVGTHQEDQGHYETQTYVDYQYCMYCGVTK